MLPFAPPLGFEQGVGSGPVSPIVRASGIINVPNTNTATIAIPGGVVSGDLLVMFSGSSYQLNSIDRCDGIGERTNQPNLNGAYALRVITAADITAGSITATMAGSYYGGFGYAFLVGAPRIRCVTIQNNTAAVLTATVAADASVAAGDVALIFTSALHGPTIASSGAPTLLATNLNADSRQNLYQETLTSGFYSRTLTYGTTAVSWTALIVLESVHPALDVNTTFLMLWDDATLVKEKRFATQFSLAGNAFVDTANNELVVDGSGDWAVKTNTTPGFVGTPDWTCEWFMNMAAGDAGGPFSHRGNQAFAPFLTGGGSLQMYVFDGNPMLTGTGVDGSAHHWAFTCENGSPFRYRLYRDGVQVATTTSANAHTMNDFATMYIGTDGFSPSGREVAGRIGPIRVSNVCRYPSGTTFSPPSKTAWA